MINVSDACIKLNASRLKCLEEAGINVPKKAVSYNRINLCKNGVDIDIITFKDKNKRPIKRLKTQTDTTTKEKVTQARYYSYLGICGPKRKLQEINQYTFNERNQCVDNINWRFYYSKKGKVNYSMKSLKEKKDNFPKSNGVVTDRNGFVFRPITIAEYLDIKKDIGKRYFVDAPWTCNESITNLYGATDSAQECTIVGVVGKKGVSLNHFNPNCPENADPSVIENALIEQLRIQGENAKAFLIGACDHDYESHRQFNLLDDFFAVRNVRHSKYKTGDNVLYNKLDQRAKMGSKDYKRIDNGEITPFYYQSGQHIAYKDGEIKITNLIIDEEMNKGNCDPLRLMKQSFYEKDL